MVFLHSPIISWPSGALRKNGKKRARSFSISVFWRSKNLFWSSKLEKNFVSQRKKWLKNAACAVSPFSRRAPLGQLIIGECRSRFASAVHLIPPASDKELVEIAKDDLLSVLTSEEKYRELWIESVEDGFMGLYDHLVDFAKFVFVIFMCL